MKKQISKRARDKVKKKFNPQRQIIGIDMDGTLCKEVCWTPEECLKATPVWETIKKTNRLYATNFVVIYTARRDNLIEATLIFLRDNGIRFHAISNNKIPLNHLIDADNLTPNDI